MKIALLHPIESDDAYHWFFQLCEDLSTRLQAADHTIEAFPVPARGITPTWMARQRGVDLVLAILPGQSAYRHSAARGTATECNWAGRELAERIHTEVCSALKLRNRGRFNVADHRLNKIDTPLVVSRPFYPGNRSDIVRVEERREKLVTAYAEAL